MPEIVDTTTQENVDTSAEVSQSASLAEAMWNEKPVQEKLVVETKTEEKKVEDKKVETSNEQIVDDIEYLKQQTGLDSWDAVKKVIDEHGKLKDVKAEHQFKNEDSKKAYEYLEAGEWEKLHDILDRKKKVQSVKDLDAEKAIRLHLELTNEHFTPADVQDVLEERYALPKKPIQGLEELEEEFLAREVEYKAQVERVQRKMNRDSFEAKAALEKLQSEIVLPDIQRKEEATTKQPTQEELATAEKFKTSFLQATDAGVKDFSGFSTTVKFREDNKDVEIPVSYGLSPEQKTNLLSRVGEFANNNYDPYTFLRERWVNKDGSDNTAQMVKDLSWLYYGEEAAEKFASDAANQRLEMYLKGKKKVNINETSQTGTVLPEGEKSKNEQLADAVWSN